MEKPAKGNPSFFIMGIVAIIVGSALFKQFDFKTFKFEHPALAAIYLITFAGAVYVLIKNRRKRTEE